MDCRMPVADCRLSVTHLTGFSICLLVVMLFSCGCREPRNQGPPKTNAKIRFTAIQDGEIWIRHSVIQLRFDSEMYCKVFLNQNGKLLSVVDIPPVSEKARPAHYVWVNGEELRDFRIDYANVGASDIRTQYGVGRRLHMTGFAKTAKGIVIEKELVVDLYNDFPELAVVFCRFHNTDKSQPVELTRIIDNFFRLDASRVGSSFRPFDFSLFQGKIANQSQVTKLLENFSQIGPFEFSRGLQADMVPFFDFWNDKMGMAVGYLAAGLEGGKFTAAVTSDKHVEAGIYYETIRTLGPTQSISTPKSVWMVHQGDYQSSLKRYQELELRNER